MEKLKEMSKEITVNIVPLNKEQIQSLKEYKNEVTKIHNRNKDK